MSVVVYRLTVVKDFRASKEKAESKRKVVVLKSNEIEDVVDQTTTTTSLSCGKGQAVIEAEPRARLLDSSIPSRPLYFLEKARLAH